MAFVNCSTKCLSGWEKFSFVNALNPNEKTCVCRLGKESRKFEVVPGQPARRKLRRKKGLRPMLVMHPISKKD